MPFHTSLIFRIFAIGAFGLGFIRTQAQEFNRNGIHEDSVVLMHGYIYDTISDRPNKIGVNAKLILESRPFGSEIGIISTNDTSGYYEYYLNLNHKYRIDIQSDLHRWYYEDLDPWQMHANGDIERDFYLKPEVKENQVFRLNKLIFEQGKSNITPTSYGELDRIVRLMSDNPSMKIQLEGHTDYRGSKRLNMELSQERVEAVKNYLTEQGISARMIKTKAFGGTMPLVREVSIEASELNRRVEVRIIKLK